MNDNNTPMQSKKISRVRQRIDRIDGEILALLHDRLAQARNIGRIKGEQKLSTWDPAREREIFARLEELNRDIFPPASIRSIFHEIISTCRASQKKVNIAYLGPEGTFSHLAGIEYFGQAAGFRATETIEDVFLEVERERAEFGVVPVENSIEGAVTSTLDGFMSHKVMTCGEINLGIRHNLINQSGSLTAIKTVVSHPQPLAQCRQWLKKNMPDIPVRAVFSTAQAAGMAAEDHGIAAIASSLALKTYSLQSVVNGIEDYSGNTTRFLVIGKKSPQASGNDKTSLLVGLINRPGALYNTLAILASHKIDLSRIESRPVKGDPGNYLFFLDMFGHITDADIAAGCEALRTKVAQYKWLGSYPCAPDEDRNGHG